MWKLLFEEVKGEESEGTEEETTVCGRAEGELGPGVEGSVVCVWIVLGCECVMQMV